MCDTPKNILCFVRAARILVGHWQSKICTYCGFRVPCTGVNIAVMVGNGRNHLTGNLFAGPQGSKRFRIQRLNAAAISAVNRRKDHTVAISKRVSCICAAANKIACCLDLTVGRVDFQNLLTGLRIQIAIDNQRLRNGVGIRTRAANDPILIHVIGVHGRRCVHDSHVGIGTAEARPVSTVIRERIVYGRQLDRQLAVCKVFLAADSLRCRNITGLCCFNRVGFVNEQLVDAICIRSYGFFVRGYDTDSCTSGICDDLCGIRLTFSERNRVGRLLVFITDLDLDFVEIADVQLVIVGRALRQRDSGFAGHTGDRRNRQLRHIVRNFHRVLKLVRVERFVQRKFLSVASDGEGGERRDNGELQRVCNHVAFIIASVSRFYRNGNSVFTNKNRTVVCVATTPQSEIATVTVCVYVGKRTQRFCLATVQCGSNCRGACSRNHFEENLTVCTRVYNVCIIDFCGVFCCILLKAGCGKQRLLCRVHLQCRETGGFTGDRCVERIGSCIPILGSNPKGCCSVFKCDSCTACRRNRRIVADRNVRRNACHTSGKNNGNIRAADRAFIGRAINCDRKGFDLFIMAENLFNLAENRVAVAVSPSHFVERIGLGIAVEQRNCVT